MRSALVLMTLVAVLSCCRTASADASSINCDRSIEIGGYRFGFVDWSQWSYFDRYGTAMNRVWTVMYAGPFGQWQVPFRATRGLTGVVCAVAVMLMTLLLLAAVRWKRRTSA